MLRLIRNTIYVATALTLAMIVDALPGGDPDLRFTDLVVVQLLVFLHLRHNSE